MTQVIDNKVVDSFYERFGISDPIKVRQILKDCMFKEFGESKIIAALSISLDPDFDRHLSKTGMITMFFAKEYRKGLIFCKSRLVSYNKDEWTKLNPLIPQAIARDLSLFNIESMAVVMRALWK